MGFQRISILGVGLLGGSIGLALKARTSSCHIIGYGHRTSTLKKAVEFGAIDEGTGELAAAVAGCDLVILCTPVGLFPEILQGIKEHLRPAAVVTDVGSTKRSVVRLGEGVLPESVFFVGSHPMAGSEKRGVEYARADLFQNALCIVTPTERTELEALVGVKRFWEGLGMRTTGTSPEEHDRLLAQVSHLPHAVAAALIAIQEGAGLGFAGKGFIDTTRIAGGDGALWRDIFLDNRDNVQSAIDRLKGELDQFSQLLERGREQELVQWLDAAATRREELIASKLSELDT